MKIAVVGSINIDMTVTADRIPKKGETLRGDTIHYIPGGKGANQAVAMARLGADVSMFGCVGNDVHGQHMIDNLNSQGVCTDHIKVLEGVPTGLAVITVAENDNSILIIAGANGKVDRAYVDEIWDELKLHAMVVLQHEIPLDTVHYIIERCYEAGIRTVLNPAPASEVPEELIDKISYLTPNEHETALIFKEQDMEQLLKKYPEKLVITLGSRGAASCTKEGELVMVPARPAKVVDTTGAGDTLNGAFAVRIAAGDGLREALTYANTAASLSTEKFGAQGGMPTDEEVKKNLK